MRITLFFGILRLVIHVITGKAIYDDEKHITISNQLSKCTVKILDEIKFNKYSEVTVVNNYADIVNITELYQTDKVSFNIQNNLTDKKVYSDIYVITSKTVEEFMEMIELANKNDFWNPGAWFVIIIEDLTDRFEEVSFILSENNLLNVTLLITSNNDFDVYIFTMRSGHGKEPLNFKKRFNSSNFQHNKIIYPALMQTSIRGCRFKMIIKEHLPYVSFNKTRAGFEQYILEDFQKHVGVEFELIEYKPITKDSYHNLIDVLSMVAKPKNAIEGAFGGFILTPNTLYIHLHSYPFMIDHIIFVLQHSHHIGSWFAVYYITRLTLIVGTILFVIFCLAASILRIFLRDATAKRDVVRDILIVFGYFLNTSTTNIIRSGFVRKIILILLLFLVFLLPNIIQAYLNSITMNPVRGLEEQDPDRILKNLRAVSVPGLLNIEQPAKPYVPCKDNLDCLKLVSELNGQKYYTLMPETVFDIYKWHFSDKFCNLKLYNAGSPKEYILRVFYFRRGSVLVQPFNKFLSALKAGGLLDKYYRDLIDVRKIVKCNSESETGFNPRTMFEYKDAFILLLIGYAVSIFVFICEVLWKIISKY